ncbi:MAG: hypothetical protein M1822_005696 [Bathelium mastoideum]|nr:MAG: hypothetical protein M1822_005696 [Bathelium mastoideum]
MADRGGRGRGRGRGRGGDRGGRGDRGGDRGGYQGGGRGGSAYPPRDQAFAHRPAGRGGAEQPAIFRGLSGHIPVSDPQVRATEDKVGANLENHVRINQGNLEKEFPDRPGYGTVGKKVTLWANYFHLQVDKDVQLHKYRIEIQVPKGGSEPKGRKLHRLIDLLLQDQFADMRHQLATDYKRTLISVGKLPTKKEFQIAYRDEGEDPPTDNKSPYRMTLHNDSEDGHPVIISVGELMSYLSSQSAAALYTDKYTAIQALNIILGHNPKSNPAIASIGPNKHFAISGDQVEQQDLSEGLTCLRGFFVSVRPATCRILLNIQVKHAAMYNPDLVSKVVSDYISGKSNANAAAHKFLTKVRVELIHLAKKSKSGRHIPRIRTIYGLATEKDGRAKKPNEPAPPHPPRVTAFGAPASGVEFYVENPPAGSNLPANAYTTVEKYFRVVYRHNCDPRRPILNVGTRERPSYVPAELCRIVAGQPAGVKLSPGQTNWMTKFSIRPPASNANTIVKNGPKLLGTVPLNDTLKAFGIATADTPNMITVDGRLLPGPSIAYRNEKMISETRNASWNLQGFQFFRGAVLRNWSYLTLKKKGQGIHFRECVAEIQAFHRLLVSSGVNATPPARGESLNMDLPNAKHMITTAFDKASRTPGPHTHLILVILPSKDITRDSVYKQIKYWGDVVYGVHTVCMTQANLQSMADGTFANIALKVNAKLGGINHSLAPKHCSLIRKGQTMIVGIDVTHPSPGSSSAAPSVAAMVASTGSELGRWPAELCVQPKAKKEKVEGNFIADLLKTRLRYWRSLRGDKDPNQFPENIIVYRDGVSEGQYQSTITDELGGMRQACKEFYPADYQKRDLPRFSVIVVGKRHHTRFYATDDRNSQGKPKNTQPGTVVDRGVTEAHNWDFFLQPHAAIQGTARPAHYYVIYDEIFRNKTLNPLNERPADVLERLTHEISYLYVRATKAVSLCPPAYYADLACERARDYLAEIYDASPELTSSGSESGQTEADREFYESKIRTHPNLKNSMFYI